MTKAYEVNFDGLIGPTHNYAGLSFGNVASMTHKRDVSHPKQAALQGLGKMKLVADLGVKQAILPPHERPDVDALRRMGFYGTDREVLAIAQAKDPTFVAMVSSSSSMWSANAATVSPSADTSDGRVHITPANLGSFFHRQLETPTTAIVLKTIFQNEQHFAHHDPLPVGAEFSDEGAANHTRLCSSHGAPGVEIFTFGRVWEEMRGKPPAQFPARQSRGACEAIARNHQLNSSRVAFIRQNPAAIDAGAFHNDVVAVGNENVLFYHELAWAGGAAAIDAIRSAFPGELRLIEVPGAAVPLGDAVKSYLFNSQLVTLKDGTMALIAPLEARENVSTSAYLKDFPFPVHYVDVRQSMQNGGGPACLRLRVVLTKEELVATLPGVFLDDALYARLRAWIEKHYRDDLHANDLADPKLLQESRTALDELTRLLGLPMIYRFQKN